MSGMRPRLSRLERRTETDLDMRALKEWVTSLPTEDLKLLIAFTEPDDTFDGVVHDTCAGKVRERGQAILDRAPDEIREWWAGRTQSPPGRP